MQYISEVFKRMPLSEVIGGVMFAALLYGLLLIGLGTPASAQSAFDPAVSEPFIYQGQDVGDGSGPAMDCYQEPECVADVEFYELDEQVDRDAIMRALILAVAGSGEPV